MNKVILVGRLTDNPEIRYTQTGKCVATITLAVDRGYGDKKKTSFIPCEAWEKKAETMGNSLVKGQKILVDGAWAQQSWETQDGQKRRKDYLLIENFEFLDSKKHTNEQQTDMSSFGNDVDPEEIPF